MYNALELYAFLFGEMSSNFLKEKIALMKHKERDHVNKIQLLRVKRAMNAILIMKNKHGFIKVNFQV